jgi:hypothetical protein
MFPDQPGTGQHVDKAVEIPIQVPQHCFRSHAVVFNSVAFCDFDGILEYYET